MEARCTGRSALVVRTGSQTEDYLIQLVGRQFTIGFLGDIGPLDDLLVPKQISQCVI